MAQGIELLRFLEPPVRPSGSPARNVQGAEPFEKVDFARLLQEVQQGLRSTNVNETPRGLNFLEQLTQTIEAEQGNEASNETSEVDESTQLMNQLSQIGRIENSSVMATIAQARE